MISLGCNRRKNYTVCLIITVVVDTVTVIDNLNLELK